MLAKKFAQKFIYIIISQAISFISSIFVARLGGASIFGNLGLASAYQDLFRSLITNSTNSAHLKINSENDNCGLKTFSLLSLALMIISNSLILCWVFYNLSIKNPVLSNLQTVLILLFILQDFIILPSFIATTDCVSRLEISRSNLISFIPLLLSNILKIIAIAIGFKEIGIAIFMLVASLFGTIYPIILFKKVTWGNLDLDLLKTYAKYSLYISAGALAHGVLLSYDKILLGFLRVSPENIGFYNAGNKLGLLLMTIGVSVGGIFLAIFSKNVVDKNIDGSLYQLKQYERYIILIFAPIIIGAMLLGKDLLFLIFGKGFEMGYVVLNISLIVAFTKILTIPYHNLLFANNKFKLFNIISISYTLTIITMSTFIGYYNLFNNVLLSVSFGLFIAGISEKLIYTFFSRKIDSRIKIIFHPYILLFFIITYLIGKYVLMDLLYDLNTYYKVIFVLVFLLTTIFLGFIIGIYEKSDIKLFVILIKKD